MRATHGDRSYPVILAHDAGQALREQIDAWSRAQRVALIFDHQVGALFAAKISAPLRRAGYIVSWHGFAPGEAHKTLVTAAALYAALSEAGIARTDVVVGLGGGLTTDLAGFVASTHLRGVTYISVATTTMAAIDAAVGGKNGVNTAAGKNQVGTICAPAAVVVDLNAIAHQDDRGKRAGLVEALKMAALFEPGLMGQVVAAAQGRIALAPVIGRALAHKIRVCAFDPREAGLRAALNYGHTVGHGIEVGEHFSLLHGEAVGLGMLAEAAFAEARGLAVHVVAPLMTALTAMNMPRAWRRASIDLPALHRDKKGDGGTVILPVVTQLGSASLHKVALADLAAFLRNP